MKVQKQGPNLPFDNEFSSVGWNDSFTVVRKKTHCYHFVLKYAVGGNEGLLFKLSVIEDQRVKIKSKSSP